MWIWRASKNRSIFSSMPMRCRARARSWTKATGQDNNGRNGPRDNASMDLMLTGRVAVITGPAKGMGAAITTAFAAEGARLALLGRDTAAIEPVEAQARAAGREAIIVPCDVTDPSQCEQAAQATKRAYGRIDILVNVAGGSGPIGKAGAQTTPEEFED